MKIRRIAATRVTDDIRISKCWAAIQLRLYSLAVSSHLTNGAAADDRKKESLWKELVTSSGNFLYNLEQCLDSAENSKTDSEANNKHLKLCLEAVNKNASREIIDYFAGQSWIHESRVMKKAKGEIFHMS